MKLILDAYIALKLVLPEADSAAAIRRNKKSRTPVRECGFF